MTYPQVPQPQFQQPQYAPQPQFQQPQQYVPQPQPQYYQPAPALQGTPLPPAPELARGTLEDFDDQVVGGGGPSVTKFHQAPRPQGSWVHVRIPRDLANTDVRQQIDFKFKTPVTYKDGKPKFDLWIPVEILASSDPAAAQQLFPEGTGVAYLRPDRGDGLKSTVQRALAAIGNPDGLRTGKLGGTELIIISNGTKPNGTPNPTKLWQVQANAPQGFPTQPAPSSVMPSASPGEVAPLAAPPAPFPQAVPVPPTATPTVMAAAPQAAPAPQAPPQFSQPQDQQVTANGETKEQLLARLNAGQR